MTSELCFIFYCSFPDDSLYASIYKYFFRKLERSVHCFNEKELIENVQKFSDNSKAVIVLSHHLLSFETHSKITLPNVFYYGGQGFNKNVQMSILETNGFLVPKWLIYPQSKEEIFDKLGETVVSKPNSYGSFKSKNVTQIHRKDNLSLLQYPLYQECIGPPYWHGRTLGLFGKTLSAYCYSHENMIQDPTKEHKREPPNGDDEEIVSTTSRLSCFMSKYYGCGIIGVDFAKKDKKYYILEVNSLNVATWWEHEKFNRPEIAYDASLKWAKNLQL